MKTVISYGGAMDSTALAYELLRDTSDEIILLYIDEQGEYDAKAGWNKIASKEKKCTDDVAAWLANNVRAVSEVRFVEQMRVMPLRATRVDPASGQTELDPEKAVMYRVRPNYTQATDAYVHWGINRLVTTALEVEKMGDVDQVVAGFNLWDTDNDFLEAFWLPSYEGITDVPMRFPYLTFKDDGSYDGIGRFDLQSRLPKELFDLTIQCHKDPPCGVCWRCTLNAYYREHCAGKTMEEIRAVDDALHRKYHLGPYVNNADPETYSMWDKYEL